MPVQPLPTSFKSVTYLLAEIARFTCKAPACISHAESIAGRVALQVNNFPNQNYIPTRTVLAGLQGLALQASVGFVLEFTNVV